MVPELGTKSTRSFPVYYDFQKYSIESTSDGSLLPRRVQDGLMTVSLVHPDPFIFVCLDNSSSFLSLFCLQLVVGATSEFGCQVEGERAG